MSTNSECQFIEIERGRWYYLLEDSDAPKNAPDWREHAAAYGPFSSEEKAEEHLDRNHANPGGYSVMPLAPGVEKIDLEADETLKGLIERAQSPRQANRYVYR